MAFTSDIGGDFGDALRWLKEGKRVARSGWNGKGMWLVLVTVIEHTGPPQFVVDPCIAMKTAGETLQPGWLASQADMLATDWRVV